MREKAFSALLRVLSVSRPERTGGKDSQADFPPDRFEAGAKIRAVRQKSGEKAIEKRFRLWYNKKGKIFAYIRRNLLCQD